MSKHKEIDIYKTNGLTVTNQKMESMGIFSTVNLLNDKIEEIENLKNQLNEAENVIKVALYIPNEDQADIVEKAAKCYQSKYMNKSGEV